MLTHQAAQDRYTAATELTRAVMHAFRTVGDVPGLEIATAVTQAAVKAMFTRLVDELGCFEATLQPGDRLFIRIGVNPAFSVPVDDNNIVLGHLAEARRSLKMMAPEKEVYVHRPFNVVSKLVCIYWGNDEFHKAPGFLVFESSLTETGVIKGPVFNFLQRLSEQDGFQLTEGSVWEEHQ